MSIRKRDDSVKPGVGIDGAKGEDFARKSTASPWAANPVRDDKGLRSISARTEMDDNYLDRSDVGIDDGIGERNIRGVSVDFETNYSDKKWAGAGTQRTGSNPRTMYGYDVWDDVEGQSSDDGNRAVKSRGND